MNRHLKQSMLLALSASVAACSMAPRYEQPENPVAGQVSHLSQRETLAMPAWQDFFQQPQLRELVDTALAHNRNMRVAALTVEEVRAQYRIQRSALVPNLSVSASGTRQRVPESVSQTGSDYTSTQYSVGLGVAAWELDLFGRVNSLRRSALEQYLASVEARRGVRLTLIAQVGETYLAWVANRTLLELAQDTLDRQKTSYQMVERRHTNGLASRLDLSRAESSVHRAQADVARYQRQFQQSGSALELLVGVDLAEQDPEAADVFDGPLLAELPGGLSSNLLLQRPDVLAAEHRLRAANANIGAARAAFFPRVALTASAGTASSELDGLFGSGTGAWSFTPQIALPIFNWGANRAALDVAQVRKDQNIARYEAAIQTAFKEARDGLQAQSTLAAQLAAQQKLVEATERALELAQVRYRKGVDSFLEVLVAQRDYNSSRQTLVTTRLALLRNRIALFKALGGGFQASS